MNRIVIVIATILHLLPRPFGVSPVGALALYAGANGSIKTSWLIPLLPLSIAALWHGLYDAMVLAFVFLGFALATLAGRWFLVSDRTRLRFVGGVSTGAVIFYAVSNFGMWLAGYYPLTASGLADCYLRGLPYLGQAVLADGIYCFLLFGLHRFLALRRFRLRTA